MSLAAVLSAMREIILDGTEIPLVEEERLGVFRSRFSGLTNEELEDLAKISPDKFAVYTKTIFAGERGNLRTHFPISFAILRKYLSRFDSYEMVRDLHKKRPWQSHLTVTLAENFVHYLETDRADVSQSFPAIGDIAEMELSSLKISRQEPDSSFESALVWSELEAFNVADFMNCRLRIGPSVGLYRFDYDVLRYRNEFRESDGKLPEAPPDARTLFTVCSRDKENNLCWLEISSEVYSLLGELRAAFVLEVGGQSPELDSLGTLEVQQLAEAVVLGKEEMSETEQFQYFLQVLFDLVDRGVVLVLPAE